MGRGRRLGRDAAADEDAGAYARTLERLHCINLMPAVASGRRQTHPDLDDRMLAAGVQPDHPRPLPPPRWKKRSVVLLFVAFDGRTIGRTPSHRPARRMSDLQSKPLIVAKGVMFFAIVALAAFAIWWQQPTLTTAALLLVLVWAAARSYYFVFHVLEKYVDPNLRWRGLRDLLRAARRRNDHE